MGRGEGPLGVNVQAGGVELTQGGRIPPPASCTTGGELSSAAERESGKMREDKKKACCSVQIQFVAFKAMPSIIIACYVLHCASGL